MIVCNCVLEDTRQFVWVCLCTCRWGGCMLRFQWAKGAESEALRIELIYLFNVYFVNSLIPDCSSINIGLK